MIVLAIRESLCSCFPCQRLIISYRINDIDDAVLLALDFPPDARAKDCYKMFGQGLRLDPVKKRIFSGLMKISTLAVTVWQQGSHAVVAALCIDGNSIFSIS
jgi:hypothetical protein